MFLKKFEQQKYDEIFEKIYNDLKHQKENDEDFKIDDLKSLLNNFYKIEGNDWTGRSKINDITDRAKIAAAQNILAEWKEELGDYESPNN
ncbi:hypothetical protein [Dethiothermospora halolimnae]|uniref:hypothetical protein n=1 Tax=Dethiothermospora halolimnae TaxID=3114390 RepID=UPI003CCBA524